MAAAAAEVAAAGGGGEMVVVRLPPLSEDDPLFQDKKVPYPYTRASEREEENLCHDSLFLCSSRIWFQRDFSCSLLTSLVVRS